MFADAGAGKAIAHLSANYLPLDIRWLAVLAYESGYCGTLMTPMAANFNIVPAALLELPDRNAVIKAQLPTALALLAVNAVLLDWLMFR